MASCAQARGLRLRSIVSPSAEHCIGIAWLEVYQPDLSLKQKERDELCGQVRKPCVNASVPMTISRKNETSCVAKSVNRVSMPPSP